MDTRKLVDYALDEDGVEFRAQLYATLHDRVMAAMESRKQSIAQNLITQEEVELEEETKGITVKKEHDNDDETEHSVHHNGHKIGYITHDKKTNKHTAWHGEKYGNDAHGDEIGDFKSHNAALKHLKRADSGEEDYTRLPKMEGAMSELDADRKERQYKGTQQYHANKKMAKHPDEKEDKAMVKKMVKPSALKDEFDNELDESWEDRLAAAREKAAAKGKIKEPENKPSGVTKHSGTRYGGSAQKPAEKPGHEEDEEETVSSKKGMKKEEEKWHMRKSK